MKSRSLFRKWWNVDNWNGDVWVDADYYEYLDSLNLIELPLMVNTASSI